MAIRYKRAAKGTTTGPATWTIPTEIWDVQTRHMGLQQHRLATPLTYNTNMQQYWSTHERDQLLGASWQPYAYQWRGYSQCSPTLDHADMEKAVRWAVHSAKHAGEQPTCTVFVLPGWRDHQHTAYMKWLAAEPEYCFKMASIKSTCLRYCTPTDQHRAHDAPYTGCHKSTETDVLLVANRAAFQELACNMDSAAYASDLGQAVRQTAGTTAAPTQGRFAEGTIKTVQQHIDMEGRHLPLRAAVPGHTPDRFLRLPSDASATGVAGPLPACAPDAATQARHTFPNTSAPELEASSVHGWQCTCCTQQ
jgi:hypothetical protein